MKLCQFQLYQVLNIVLLHLLFCGQEEMVLSMNLIVMVMFI